MAQRFTRNGWPRGTELFDGTTMTASATPHTKGSWVDLDASVSRDICGFYISTSNGVFIAATDTSMLIDIGVGGTGNAVDQIKVNNLPVGGAAAYGSFIFLPLHVRAGERIAGRIQAAVVSDTYAPRLILCFADRPPGWGGYSESATYTANTATSGPTTGDLTDNAWDEAVASTTDPIRALTVHLCHQPGSTVTSALATMTVDVGVGGAGSEVQLGTWQGVVGTSESATSQGPDFIEVEIPTGSRLALRKNGTENMSGLIIGWR